MTPRLLFPVGPVDFVTPRPPSKKNRGVVVSWGPRCPCCGKQPKHGYRPSPDAKKAEDDLREWLTTSLRAETESRFGDRDVGLEITHYARRDELAVRVIDMGPRPKGFSGRKADLANVLDVLCDAMQGPVYDNDNQVAAITLRRSLEG